MQQYPWAANKTKLHNAFDWARKQKELNPNFEINEAVIKQRYTDNKGLVLESKERPVEVVTPVAKMKLEDLKVRAKALGIEVAEDDTRATLIEKIEVAEEAKS